MGGGLIQFLLRAVWDEQNSEEGGNPPAVGGSGCRGPVGGIFCAGGGGRESLTFFLAHSQRAMNIYGAE